MNIRYDVFNAERLEGATFIGDYEFPAVRGIKLDTIPSQIVSLDKLSARNCNGCLAHGYVEDYKYGRVYTRPDKYLKLLKRADIVIGLDHSTYRDLPLTEQIHSMYLNRATDYWWQRNGIRVVPNVACADERTYDCFCDGIEHGATISNVRIWKQASSGRQAIFHGRRPPRHSKTTAPFHTHAWNDLRRSSSHR